MNVLFERDGTNILERFILFFLQKKKCEICFISVSIISYTSLYFCNKHNREKN